MYLKSIDICGYKSFANKTHVELEPGITGVIGPNGCGKSNVMESVRWCLGEMSWKSLRADAMTDVIFSGTAKRQAMSMTEVTLTFDNQAGMLPVQFSEVTVTRRIFRSGESAYFLNKTQCRLRDIRELFLDTGVGGDGYAIIDQGGVDAMIMSKPEERRAFFEEAAGVAKYNAKRAEALRKLERVEMDMGRLQDSVTLINEQVKKLDSDARKAKLFQKYKEELAAAEAANILQQLGTLEGELAALTAQVAPLEESLGSKRTEMNAEGANVAALNLEKANAQGAVIEANQKISELKSELGRLEERIQSSERACVESDERAHSCRAELEGIKARLSGIDPELERAKAAVAEAQAACDAAKAEVDGAQAQLQALSERQAAAEVELDSLRRAALSAAEAALGVRRRLSEAESAWSRQETQVRASLRELDKDGTQWASCQSEISTVRAAFEAQQAAAAEARAEAERREAALSERRKQLSELSEQTLRLHADLAGAQARAEAIEAQGGQNPYWVGAQAVLNAGIPGVLGTVRQLFKVDDAHKAPLEDLLGERLYAVVVEDSTAARAAIELLEASGKGRARFLVLSTLPEQISEKAYPAESKPLLNYLTFDPRHERAVRFLFAESYALGEFVFTDHWVYGGSAQRESVQVSLSDLQEVREKTARLTAQEAELSSARAACEGTIAEAEAAVRAAAAAVSEQVGREHALRAQLAEKEASLQLYAKNVELSTAEAARLLAEMALSKEAIHAARAAIAEAAAVEEQARAKEAEGQAAVAAAREEWLKAQAAQEFSRGKLQAAEDKLTFMRGAYDRLAAEKTALEGQVAQREQELEALAQKRQAAVELSEQSRQRLGELSGELGVQENAAKAIFERLHELERQILSKDDLLRSLRKLCDEAQEQLHKLELEASGKRSTQDMLRQRLWDDWQLTYDEAKTKYQAQSVDQERMEFLRKRIVSLGNVNMAAPEEYEALSQKQQFLAAQIQDLTQAKEDLKAAIGKINGATRENFANTFNEVREHFRKLYGVLFEGGEADLILTNPEDILETGVDIMAQPPGKRLQSISLLSGGEKTLTAIALLFAFFMVKPSPFCMLDEADAALDDANVERFVSLLRQFQDRTQFLIVSHNKRTMEAADVIYGVTMEEMGVSQLVSVDFRGKERKKPAVSEQARTASPELPPAEPPSKPTTHGPFELKTSAPAESSSATAVLEAPAEASAVVAETAVEPAAEAVPEAPVAEASLAQEAGTPAIGMVGTTQDAEPGEPAAEAAPADEAQALPETPKPQEPGTPS